MSDRIPVGPLWPGPARPRPLKPGRARTKLETAELKPSRAQAGSSSSEVVLGLEREVGPRQAREQGHLEQSRLGQGLASLEAEGEPGESASARALADSKPKRRYLGKIKSIAFYIVFTYLST